MRFARITAVILAIAGLVAVAIGWRAPASLASQRIERFTQGKVRLAAAEGTLWNGQGVIDAGGVKIPLAWRMEALPILRRELHLTLAPAGTGATTPRGTLLFAANTTRLRDVRLELPAGSLVTALVREHRLSASGTLALEAAALDWGPQAAAGEIVARWQDAALGLDAGPAIALGNIEARLRAQGDELQGPLGNEGGDIAIDGTLGLRRSGFVSVRLTLRPRNPEDPRWAAMGITGLQTGDSFPVEWQGRAW